MQISYDLTFKMFLRPNELLNGSPAVEKKNHIRPRAINERHDVRRAGFTLIEVLAAMFILSIIFTLIFGSFQGVFSDADHINAASDIFEMGHSCLNRMTMDLEAIHVKLYPRYQPPDIDDPPDIYRVAGTVDSLGGESFASLRFTSLAHLPLNQEHREGIAEIVYYVQHDDDNGYLLRRADHLYPYPEFAPSESDPILCEKLQSFEISYYSAEGDDYQRWDSDSDDMKYDTPKRIGIRIALVTGNEQLTQEFMTEVALPLYRLKDGGDGEQGP